MNFFFYFSLLLLFISIQLWIYFDRFTFKYQYIINNCNNWLNIEQFQFDFIFGVDGISLFFIILTTFILLFIILNLFNLSNRLLLEYLAYFFLIEICLLLAFAALDLFLFFLFFESVLIPMYLIIGKWGSRDRKIKANFYFYIYTMLGSIFLLFTIITIQFEAGSSLYCVIHNISFENVKENIYWLFLFIAFSVKIPSFPFHLWLPEAHVEAPTVGSVILAALLLKLGGYGFIRILIPCFTFSNYFFSPLVYSCCLISIIHASFTAMRQIDLKRIIAYSSIAHMNFGILGLFSLTIEGIQGCLFLMLAHGVVSAALFFSIGILYDKYHSRNLYYYGGLVQIMPIFSIYFLIFCFANIGVPGSCNFIGELLIMLGLINKNFLVLIIASTSVVFSVIYTMTCFNKVIFGNIKIQYIQSWQDISKLENTILLPKLILTLILGIQPNIILDSTLSSTFILTQICN